GTQQAKRCICEVAFPRRGAAVWPLQHRCRGDDGRLHDVPELRRFEVWVVRFDVFELTDSVRHPLEAAARGLPLLFVRADRAKKTPLEAGCRSLACVWRSVFSLLLYGRRFVS